MKKLKRLAALVLALSLIVSLGAGASAASDEEAYVRLTPVDSSGEEDLPYIHVTPSTPATGIDTYTLQRTYSGSLYETVDVDVGDYSGSVAFTIENTHSEGFLTIGYIVYEKQPEGSVMTFNGKWDESLGDYETYTKDMSGEYVGEYTAQYLTQIVDNGATPVGDDRYWSNSSNGSLWIYPGESVTVSFDASMAKDDNVVYQLFFDLWIWGWSCAGEYFLTLESSDVAGFTDVSEDAYYADAVVWAVDNGVTEGVSKTEFAPADTVTRAQAVTFLWRAYGKPEPTTTTSKFKDVKDTSAYYYKAVLWAAENGITTGVSDTWFDLNSKLTYDEILTFLCRAAGGDASGADWSEKAQTWAKTNGVSANLDFTAKGSCPRSDVVYCLYNQLAK